MGGAQLDEQASMDAAIETILVVDDEVLVRMVIADHLRDCGFRVFEAGNGSEAIAVLSSGEPVDLVFSDVQMPECNGFELARWVRRERPDVKVMLTSGGVKAAETASDLCENGPLLGKPYDVGEVVRRIRSTLARETSSNDG